MGIINTYRNIRSRLKIRKSRGRGKGQGVKREQLIGRLRQIEALVAQCLNSIGQGPGPAPGFRKTTPVQKVRRNALPDRIVELRDKGFFAQPRTAREVQAKLNPTYACEVDRVCMALLRLVKRKKLRKASKMVGGKKQVAYVW